MLPVLSDNCTPHLNQTAYQRGVSSANATFSCQVTISKFIVIPLSSSVKCLGAWWSPSLSCTKLVKENIEKARHAFFARASGVFHGTLNPLSSMSIVKHCVLPCLLFGASTWILIYCRSWSPIKLSSPSASFGYQPSPLTTLPSWLCSGHLSEPEYLSSSAFYSK